VVVGHGGLLGVPVDHSKSKNARELNPIEIYWKKMRRTFEFFSWNFLKDNNTTTSFRETFPIFKN